MKNRKIGRVRDGEWTGLTYHPADYDEALPLGEPTIEEYAELCDQAAESANQHAFCGTHRALVEILRRNVAEPDALAVMRDIAESGGLQKIVD
jgi:hypothetical protein